MESLKIKCPVCGIILEVTNSKNEAVKRIVCPYCKKTLAITFSSPTGEVRRGLTQKSSQDLEMVALPALFYQQMRIALQEGQNQIPLPDADSIIIRVVRLKDGNCKCLVRTKHENTVRLNNEYLLLDDEVALSDGDQIRFGKTVLSFNKPFDNDVTPLPPPPSPSKRHWWVAVAACIVAVILIAVFWHKEENADNVIPPIEKKEGKDTLIQKPGNSGTSTNNSPQKKVITVIKKTSIKYSDLDDYELQQMAKDDVKAQYVLGKRLVNRKDSTYIVLGANYLKLASRNGSSEAPKALQNVKSTLREAADRGNTHAANLLKVINGEQ